jgi:hypothetical protein
MTRCRQQHAEQRLRGALSSEQLAQFPIAEFTRQPNKDIESTIRAPELGRCAECRADRAGRSTTQSAKSISPGELGERPRIDDT